ncbi:MAG: PH domain-containing protein [Candidatus Aenigmatarchaeota archaeon]
MEDIKYKTSRVSYIPNYVLTILLITFISLIYLNFGGGTFFVLLLCPSFFIIFFLVFEAEFEKIFREYRITEDGITKIEGVLSKKSTTIPYLNVSDVRLYKSVLGRMFKYGDVEIKGYNEEIKMRGIRNPEWLYERIKEKISSATGRLKEGREKS